MNIEQEVQISYKNAYDHGIISVHVNAITLEHAISLAAAEMTSRGYNATLRCTLEDASQDWAFVISYQLDLVSWGDVLVDREATT